MPRTPISAPATSRAYPLLWGGTASANLADGITLAVGPLLAAAITRDPALVAGLVVAQRLPWLLFVLFAGVIVDRFDRRMLLIAGNVLRFVALGGITVALAAGVRELWLLYVVAFLLGMAETIVDNASLAILPQLVNRTRMSDANGRLFATQSIVNELIGPPLGSVIFAFSAVAAFASGSAVFLLAAIVYALLPRRPREPDPTRLVEPVETKRASVRAELAEGLRWFGRSPMLILMSSMAATINLMTFATMAVFVLFSQDRLGLNEAGYGILLAAGAIGGIPAGLLGPAIIRRLGEGPVLIGATALAGVAYFVAATTTSPIVMGVTMVTEGVAFTLSNIVVITLRQNIVPNALLGRVTSVYRLIAVGAMPIGALMGGLVARAFGLTAPFWVAAVGLVLLAIVIAPFMRTSRIRALPPGDPVHADPPIPGAPVD
ncbi:MAG TPA: MFS transporter [Solirubrobacteraceae bacterium]|nr:MFS transporter [Solirubrobacteraceae bacterium]